MKPKPTHKKYWKRPMIKGYNHLLGYADNLKTPKPLNIIPVNSDHRFKGLMSYNQDY